MSQELPGEILCFVASGNSVPCTSQHGNLWKQQNRQRLWLAALGSSVSYIDRLWT